MNNKCKYEPCSRPGVSRGLCTAHYAQLRRGVELAPIKPYVRRTIDTLGVKECSVCHVTKEITGFSPRPNGKPQSACRECSAAKARETRQKARLWDLQQAQEALQRPQINTVDTDTETIKGGSE